MESFDTNSKDLGFSGVQTLGEAKDKLKELDVKFVGAVQNRFEGRKSRYTDFAQKEYGIHIYFIDMFGNELAYYTPIMKSLMVFAKPRKVGIKQDLVYV